MDIQVFFALFTKILNPDYAIGFPLLEISQGYWVPCFSRGWV